eukprot:802357-Rhodomonas_salina.4
MQQERILPPLQSTQQLPGLIAQRGPPAKTTQPAFCLLALRSHESNGNQQFRNGKCWCFTRVCHFRIWLSVILTPVCWSALTVGRPAPLVAALPGYPGYAAPG